jgi:hypothetical protein
MASRRKTKKRDQLLARLTRPSPWPSHVDITLDQDVNIVGESNYAANIRAMTGDAPEVQVVGCLIPEPTNPYDPRAIAVHAGSGIVGYIAKGMTADFWDTAATLILASGHCAVALNLYGGDIPYARLARDVDPMFCPPPPVGAGSTAPPASDLPPPPVRPDLPPPPA